MNRIDQQKQFVKKPIPAISEAERTPRPESDLVPDPSSWLSNALAIWIEQDKMPLHNGGQDGTQTPR